MMTGGKELSQDSYIRSLPYSVLRYIAMHLDTDSRWKHFATCIPKRLTNKLAGGEFQERYSTLQIDMFEVRGRQPGASPTLLILNDWATQNAQLRHLLEAFERAKLQVVTDYLLNQMGRNKSAKIEEINNRNNTAVPSLTANLSRMEVGKGDDDDPKKNLYMPKFKDSDFSSGSSFSSSGSERETSYSFTSKPSADLEAGNVASMKHSIKIENKPENMSVLLPCGCSNPVGTKVKDIPVPCLCNSSREMSYAMLQNFTKNFAELDVAKGGNMIGCGGFGVVFIAESPDGCKAAVKQLRHPGDPLMEKQFQTELEKLSKFRHENIVSLLGYSIDGSKKCLVYDYMPNGSLEERLCCFRKTEPLPWKRRLEIVLGTANGIAFLNNEGEVHRDIKSANVLLDENFVPKVGDFATVRTGPSGSSTTAMETMQVIGTSAYMAPEAIRFDVSAKLDSFAFGVVLLEILTGLAPNDPHREEADLWSHVQETCDEDSDIADLLDNSAGDWKIDIAVALFAIAQKCLQERKRKRALVSDILPDLEKFVQTCCSDTFV